MTRVKICGITTLEDATAAVRAGAHALGFVFADSPRRVTPDDASDIVRRLPPMVTTVGVFLDAPLKEVQHTMQRTSLHCVQLHGNEPPDYCNAVVRPVIKRIAIHDQTPLKQIRADLTRYRVSAHLLDPGSGQGEPFDWRRVAPPGATASSSNGDRTPLIVAGGLNHHNVREAITILQPFAVDVCTGVESSPGKKDATKLEQFLQAVEQADAAHITRH